MEVYNFFLHFSNMNWLKISGQKLWRCQDIKHSNLFFKPGVYNGVKVVYRILVPHKVVVVYADSSVGCEDGYNPTEFHINDISSYDYGLYISRDGLSAIYEKDNIDKKGNRSTISRQMVKEEIEDFYRAFKKELENFEYAPILPGLSVKTRYRDLLKAQILLDLEVATKRLMEG